MFLCLLCAEITKYSIIEHYKEDHPEWFLSIFIKKTGADGKRITKTTTFETEIRRNGKEGIFYICMDSFRPLNSRVREIKKYRKNPVLHPLKPWKDPESLFCDTSFLQKLIGKEVGKGEECKGKE